MEGTASLAINIAGMAGRAEGTSSLAINIAVMAGRVEVFVLHS